MTRTTPRTTILFITVACAFSLTLADVAAAQTTSAAAPSTTTVFSPGHWTVTPFIGVGFSGDVDSATGALGAAAGYVWSDRMSFEGEFNVLPSSEANGVVEVATKVWSLTGNVLYHFSGRTVVPYGVVGIGFGHASADLGTSTSPNVDSSSSEFVLNFGGGVERRWTERLAVRGDLRYFFGGDLVPDYWRLSGGVMFDIRRR
jgi:opacity protein-like surface antigen